jgi:hypothetical protein
MRDPYELLAVSRTATSEEIAASVRRLTEELRPDVDRHDPKAVALLGQYKAAYELLVDEKRRRAFDRGEIESRHLILLPTPRRRSGVRRKAPLIIASLILAATSALIVQRLTPPKEISASPGGKDTDLPLPGASENQSGAAIIRPPGADPVSAPRLVLQQSSTSAAGDAVSLGIQVSGDAVGLAVEISGLPAGTTISSGRPMTAGRWRILAADVGNATIQPPPGFSGAFGFTVELRLTDDTVIDRRSSRLEWMPSVAPAPIESAHDKPISDASIDQATATSAPAEQHASRSAAKPQLDREHIEILIGRSQKLVSEGDVGAARTLLQHAAEAGDARAALALGGTYDPIMLAILQARGVAADISLARDWYKKASELGSPEAEERLKLLSSTRPRDGEPIDRAKVPRNVKPEPPDKRAASVPAKPISRVLRPPIHQSPPSPDSNGVYVAGDRVGADPDPNIRTQLLRDDASRGMRTDSASHQLLTNPVRPAPGGQ